MMLSKLTRFAILLTGLLAYNSGAAQHPHENDPGPIQHEHAALFELVKDEYTTHTAINSGAWLDETTWKNGIVPTNKAHVVIAANVHVVINSVIDTAHKTVRVDGMLEFATNSNTLLRVDTLIVNVDGHLIMGTEDEPVQGNVEARIVIADMGEIDTHWDPTELSRGLISHGKTTMHGEEKTGSMLLAEPLTETNTLILDGRPKNWKVGDVLVIPGNRLGVDTTVQIKSSAANNGNRWKVDFDLLDDAGEVISGNLIAEDYALMDGKLPFVINVTRNVIVESENLSHSDEMGINRRRGHVMFMHSGVTKTDTRYVGVYGLGRTDKNFEIDNPELNEHGHRIAGTGTNTIGRYAWHYHIGDPASEQPAIAKGIAIVNSPGLGLVNHTSNVLVSDSVAYDVTGSAFYSEVGDEIGFFNNVAAIRMLGGGGRSLKQGQGGHGVWINGGGVTVKDIKVAGARHAGFIFYGRHGLDNGTKVAEFDVSLLRDNLKESLPANASGTVMSNHVPFELDGGLVLGCQYAIAIKYHIDSRDPFETYSDIRNIIGVNNEHAISLLYTNYVEFDSCELIGMDLNESTFHRSDDSAGRTRINYTNMTVKGWNEGLVLTGGRTSAVTGGTFQNVRDIVLRTMGSFDRESYILGNIEFKEISPEFNRENIYLRKDTRNISHIIDYKVVAPDVSSDEPVLIEYTLVKRKDGEKITHKLYLNVPDDRDKDGLFDSWEDKYVGDMSQIGSDDFDGNGIPNIEQFLRPEVVDIENNPDDDQDGIADSWEEFYFSESPLVIDGRPTLASDGSMDSDNDGVIDFFEYLYGSNPTDPEDSGFRITAKKRPQDNTIVFEWEVQEDFECGTDYHVYVSTNLNRWNWLRRGRDYKVERTPPEGLDRSLSKIQLRLNQDYEKGVFIRLQRQ